MKNIKISGANNLNKIQLFNLGRISNNYYNKIDRIIDNDFILTVNLKCHERASKGDKKKSSEKPMKFGVQLQVKSATKGLTSCAKTTLCSS